jgi:hypothetical protein
LPSTRKRTAPGTLNEGRQRRRRRHVQTLDVVLQRIQLAVIGDLPVAQDRHAVGHAFQVAGDVRREDDRPPPVGGDFQDRLEEIPPARSGPGWPAGSSRTEKVRLMSRVPRMIGQLLKLSHRQRPHPLVII